MSKSFYDLDYIIEISEKRLAEYIALYQKVLERLTNIILVYSALGIFLVPLTQHVFDADIKGWSFYVLYSFFAGLLLVSVVYVVRLLLPTATAYLHHPKRYYDTFKTKLESGNPGDQAIVDNSLKGAYILELEKAITINKHIFRQKRYFFYNALIFALLAAIPYTVCIGFHLSMREGKVSKIELGTLKKGITLN